MCAWTGVRRGAEMLAMVHRHALDLHLQVQRTSIEYENIIKYEYVLVCHNVIM